MKNTKRLAIFSIFLVFVLMVNSSFALAADMTYDQIFASSVVMKLGSSAAYVNGEQKAIDENKGVVPRLKADRTFVPLRFLSENFGAYVSYNDADESVTITSGDSKIILIVGSADMTVNGETVTLDAAPFVENDRTFVPIRAITESLEKKVFWHDSGIIVVGDNDSISDEIAEKLSALYAEEVSSADVAEADPYTYFTDETAYTRVFAPGVVRPDECTFEFTMNMDRTMDGLRSNLTPLVIAHSHKEVYGTPIVLFQFYPWLVEYIVADQPERTGMKFTVLNGTDSNNQLVCTHFADYEVGKPVNVAFSWKANGKMAFYMNGQLMDSKDVEHFFPEDFLQYSFGISNLERYGISQIKVSSKALDTTELNADPSAAFTVDDNTTMLVKGNMEDIKYYTSKWHREVNYSRLTAAFRADKQICTSEEKIVYPLMALNKTGKYKNYTVKLTATNSDGVVAVNRDVPITVPGDGNYHIFEVSLPELTGNTGFYSIHAEFLDDGVQYDTLDSAIAVFPSNDETIADGLMSNIYGNEFTLDMPFSIFTKSNATTTRLQRVFHWNDLEPDEGYWDFSLADKYVDRCKKENIEILGVLGKTPYWASDGDWGVGMPAVKPSVTVPRDLDEWSNYVYTVVSRYKDYVKTWEIWNEVDWMPPISSASWNGTQDQYIELLGAAYKAVKRADPDATVTTSGFGNLDKGGIGWQVATKLLEEPYRTGYYDAFNGHGYRSADEYDDFLKEMNEKRPGTKIWMGEEMPMSADTEVQKAYSMVNKYIAYTERGFCKYLQMSYYDLFTSKRTDSPSYAYQCMAALQQLIRKCDTLEGTYKDFKNSQYLGLKHYYKRTDGKYLSIFGSDAVKGNVYFTNDNVKVYSDVGKEIQPSVKDGAKGVYLNVAAYVVSDEPLNLVNFENGGSKELLSDGGFENVGGDLAFGELYPISWTEAADADKGGDINMKEDSKSGKYALYLKSTASGAAGVTQLSPLKDAGEYNLTLSAKRISGDKNSKITVNFKNIKTGETATEEITGIGSEWKTASLDFDFKTDFEDGAQIEITSVGDAEILIDEVSLGSVAGSDEFAGNLVSNYSFDNGLENFDISNQTQNGYVELTDNGITGKSAKVVGDGTGEIKVVSTVSANVAGKYKYTARFKRIKGRSVIPYVFIYDVAINKINSVKVSELYGYKYVTATVYMDIEVPSTYVRVAAGISSGAGEILVDDVSFTLVTD